MIITFSNWKGYWKVHPLCSKRRYFGGAKEKGPHCRPGLKLRH
jgi:hypothetical protein